MNVRTINMGSYDKCVFSLGESHGCLIPNLVCFLRCDFSGLKGLPNLICNHIMCLGSSRDILACMTFLYSEEELGKRMLTIDSLPAEAVATFQKEDDINIQETYEMVLEDQHCIVLLKFVSTESLQSNQEQAVTRYRASVIDFFEEYTQFLKSQENIE